MSMQMVDSNNRKLLSLVQKELVGRGVGKEPTLGGLPRPGARWFPRRVESQVWSFGIEIGWELVSVSISANCEACSDPRHRASCVLNWTFLSAVMASAHECQTNTFHLAEYVATSSCKWPHSSSLGTFQTMLSHLCEETTPFSFLTFINKWHYKVENTQEAC